MDNLLFNMCGILCDLELFLTLQLASASYLIKLLCLVILSPWTKILLNGLSEEEAKLKYQHRQIVNWQAALTENIK